MTLKQNNILEIFYKLQKVKIKLKLDNMQNFNLSIFFNHGIKKLDAMLCKQLLTVGHKKAINGLLFKILLMTIQNF